LTSDFNLHVINILEQAEMLSKTKLMKKISELFPELPESTINWRLHKLKTEGKIQSPHYGTYSLKTNENFTPVLTSSIKRLYNRIHKEFPDIQLCVWETKWFDEFLPQPADNNYIVAEVEKEYLEVVYNSLTDLSKKIFLDPDSEILSRYISNIKDAIIIKPIISESPSMEIDNIRIAVLEKLLVDFLAETEKPFPFLKKVDMSELFKTVIKKYNLSDSKMKRYSKRRSQHLTLTQLLTKIK
jgi:hypothetical protein